MALMFARLAHNYIKNGYFPTDEATLERIGNLLELPAMGAARLLDPCCGEGTALADIRQMLLTNADPEVGNPPTVDAYGVEFDLGRARHAKQLLDRAIHADIHDVVIKARSFGLLFLNPPYGYGVSDNANRATAEIDHDKAERLERTFLKKTAPCLAHGGVLVYIIPFYALDEDIRHFLARNFQNLRVFMSPERQFKQCVIVGTRCKSGYANKAVLDTLARAQASEEGAPELPESWEEERYVVSPAPPDQDFAFHAVRMDEEQLRDELHRYDASTLWNGLESHFVQAKGACRPPLRDMTPWHLALALAAGQVTGMIDAQSGRRFLIKGDTYKRKERTVTTEVNEKGESSQIVVLLDRFVPVINAIEFTPDHRLGQIVKIA